MLDFGLLEVASHLGGSGPLVEKFAVHLDFEILVVGLRGFELIFGVEDVSLQLRIGELKDYAAGLHDGAGMNQDAIDAGVGLRGNPADVLGDKRAEAVHVAQHRAAFYLVGPDGGFIDGGGGWAEM